MISKGRRREEEKELLNEVAQPTSSAIRKKTHPLLLTTCHRTRDTLRNLPGLSYPREVIGNVWKFLTSPIAASDESGEE